METRDDWAKIEFEESRESWREGWVDRQFVRLESHAGRSEPKVTFGLVDTYANGFGADFELSLDDASLKCRKDGEGGYRSCDIRIELSHATNFNGSREPTVIYACDAGLLTVDATGGRKAVQSNGRSKIVGRDGNGRLDLTVNLHAPAPIVSARITDIACAIRSVRE